MRTNPYLRALAIIAIASGAVAIVFAVVGLSDYIPSNALWALAPDAGAWAFSQARWWAGGAGVSLLLWIAVKAVIHAVARKDELVR